MKHIEYINKKRMTVERFLLVTVATLFIVSLVLALIFSPGIKKVFIYESMDSDMLYFETRHIPPQTVQGDIAYFVEELLLGPISDRYRPLFAKGTRVLSCFIGTDEVLYINLSEEALLQQGESSSTAVAYDLLKKNVLKNFNDVDNIEVFIIGNKVSEY